MVLGSVPWFWRKKMTRFGAPAILYLGSENAAREIPGKSADPKPDASICRDFLRFIMMVEC